jgi:hypothetical protein
VRQRELARLAVIGPDRYARSRGGQEPSWTGRLVTHYSFSFRALSRSRPIRSIRPAAFITQSKLIGGILASQVFIGWIIDAKTFTHEIANRLGLKLPCGVRQATPIRPPFIIRRARHTRCLLWHRLCVSPTGNDCIREVLMLSELAASPNSPCRLRQIGQSTVIYP